jgi:hypothetical protein
MARAPFSFLLVPAMHATLLWLSLREGEVGHFMAHIHFISKETDIRFRGVAAQAYYPNIVQRRQFHLASSWTERCWPSMMDQARGEIKLVD